MSHTHPKYAWEPIDGTKVTRKCARLKKKQVFNAWTKYGNGKNISLTTTRFGLLHGVLVQTADTINIECLICKYWRSLKFFKVVLSSTLGKWRAWCEIPNLCMRFVILNVRNPLLCTVSMGPLYGIVYGIVCLHGLWD